MKKSGKVVSLFLVVFLLVGCMNYDVTMTINSNKSVNLEMNMEMNLLDFANDIVADDGMWSSIQNQIVTNTCASSCPYDENSIEYTNCLNACVESANSSSTQEAPTEEELKEYLDMYLNSEEFNAEEFFSEESRQELENEGYTVETNLDKENYTYTIAISQQFALIDTLSTTNDLTVNLEDVFNGTTDNLFFQHTTNDTYVAHFTFEPTTDTEQNTEIDFSEYITFDYIVQLPNKAISNNATEVSNDGKTLTWNLDLTQDTDIQYEFSFTSEDNNTEVVANTNNELLKIVSICLMAGGSLGLVIVIILFIRSNKKDM